MNTHTTEQSMYEQMLHKLQPMTLDETEAYWPEIEKLRDSGLITDWEYKDLCDYCFTP
jgi:hypothetical protein